MKENEVSVLEQYDIDVKSTRRIRGAVLCDAKQGLFVLKEIEISEKRLPMLYKLYEHLENMRCDKVDALLKNKEEELCSVSEAVSYTHLDVYKRQGMENSFTGEQGKVQDINVKEENLPKDLKAKGIRLIATEANKNDCWLEIREIQINDQKEEPADTERYTGTVTFNGISTQSGTTTDKMFDGDLSTEAWLAKGPYENPNRDTIAVDAYIPVSYTHLAYS